MKTICVVEIFRQRQNYFANLAEVFSQQLATLYFAVKKVFFSCSFWRKPFFINCLHLKYLISCNSCFPSSLSCYQELISHESQHLFIFLTK
jgi:hypothetical protein